MRSNAETVRRAGRRSGERSASESDASRDRWLISYADLATLLFALFVVLYAAANHERARAIASAIATQLGEAHPSSQALTDGGPGILNGADSMEATHKAIERTLAANQALGARARIIKTERGLIVSLAEAGFFPSGEATMREDALPLVDALADSLADSNLLLRVEGHTDTTPISTSRYPSNWELSAARASAVLGRLVKRGIAPSRLSVAGYAGERPVADNSTSEGRALNRRVDLVILRTQE